MAACDRTCLGLGLVLGLGPGPGAGLGLNPRLCRGKPLANAHPLKPPVDVAGVAFKSNAARRAIAAQPVAIKIKKRPQQRHGITHGGPAHRSKAGQPGATRQPHHDGFGLVIAVMPQKKHRPVTPRRLQKMGIAHRPRPGLNAGVRRRIRNTYNVRPHSQPPQTGPDPRRLTGRFRPDSVVDDNGTVVQPACRRIGACQGGKTHAVRPARNGADQTIMRNARWQCRDQGVKAGRERCFDSVNRIIGRQTLSHRNSRLGSKPPAAR